MPKFCPFMKHDCIGSRCALWDTMPYTPPPTDLLATLGVWGMEREAKRMDAMEKDQPGRCGMGKGDNFRDPHLDSE